MDYATEKGQTLIRLKDYWLIQPEDFSKQYTDYLELTDEARIRLIQKAHQMDAAVVEMHSHPGPWPAAFSPTDCWGLKQVVPHMQWRLKGKPYLAIVVAPSGYDALLWEKQAKTPVPLGGIQVDNQLLQPTNLTTGDWEND